MLVTKRDGKTEKFDISKIKKMIKWATDGLEVNPLELESQLSVILKDGVKTEDIHKNSIISANNLTSFEEPDWRYVAGRLYVMHQWKNLKRNRGYIYSLKKTVETNCKKGIYSKEIYDMYSHEQWEELNSYIQRDRDLTFDFTGAHTIFKRYLLPNENIQEMFMVISAIIANANGTYVEGAKKIYDVISTGKISLATPILLNLRRPEGNLTSCFILDVKDDLSSIMDTAKEFAFISKNAGAAGINLSKIRAHGSYIKHTKGAAAGVVPYIKVLNDISVYIDQMGKRAGSVTPALPVWHLDFFDYLDTQTETGDQRLKAHDVFLQSIVPDIFMERLKNDEDWLMFDPYEIRKKFGVEMSELEKEEFEKYYKKIEDAFDNGELEFGKKVRARLVFKQIIATAMIKGTPYWAFVDTINKFNPAKKIGKIPHGNLCVTGDTKILTKEYGHIEIEKVAGETLECWDGEEFVKCPIFRTDSGNGQKVLKVTLSNGVVIEATEYHRWRIATGKKNNKVIIKETKELTPGDKIAKFSLPIIEGEKELPLAYENGLYTAEGHLPVSASGIQHLYLYHNKRNLLPYLSGYYSVYEDSAYNRTLVKFRGLMPKHFVPDNTYTIQSRLKWFAGLCDGDGCITNNNGSLSLQIASTNKEFLNNVRLMLQTLGVETTVLNLNPAGMRKMPDGTGGYKEYKCKATFRLCLNATSLKHLFELGLKFNRLSNEVPSPNRNARKFIKVISIEDEGKIVPTYCGTNEKRGTLTFNGVVTMNCMESFSVVTEKYGHSCNLVSIVSPRVSSEEFEYIVGMSVEILDTIIDLTHSPIERANEHNHAFRVLGVGFLGFADWMAKNSLSYEKKEDLKAVSDYFEKASIYAAKKSIELAKKRGTFPEYENSEWAEGKIYGKPLSWYKENSAFYNEWEEIKKELENYGIRNLQIFAIAPNSSTGLLQGVTPSILPPWDVLYVDSSALGNLLKMPLYIKDKQWFYKPYKNYNRFAMNDFIATVQKWIDSGISYEVVFNLNDDTIFDVADFYIDAWEKGVKTIYYIRWIQPSGDVSEKEEDCLYCAN